MTNAKNHQKRPFFPSTLGICLTKEGWVGRKIHQRFRRLVPLIPNLPNLNIYIYKGGVAAHHAVTVLCAELKDGLGGWARWALCHNLRNSLTKTAPNYQFSVRHAPNHASQQ